MATGCDARLVERRRGRDDDTLRPATEGRGTDDCLDGLTEELEPPSGWPGVALGQQGSPLEPSRGGRPSLYTVPRVLGIIAELFDGASRADAAKKVGVGVSTMYEWLRLGRTGHPTYAPFAEAAEITEHNRSLNTAFGHAIRRRRFWNRFQ